MADNAVPTLAPEKKAEPHVKPLYTEKEALFDSIAGREEEEPQQSSTLKTFLTGLLWFGYTVAIIVALVLVWSAAAGLLKSLPR